MTFDKVKAMRNAERFLSQGKTRAAIGEYKRIVENDPKEYSTLNVLGDLYFKNNEPDEAVGCYTKVAEHFSKQGFSQKAIAIYNKISRIQPNSADVSAKLAKLYQQKGSLSEARSHYVALAEQFQRKGQKNEALEIWKQIAELDPTNTEVYLKIAEFCSENDNKDEAGKAFTEAAIRLSKQNQPEAALAAFSRALEIRPDDLNALNGYVNIQIKLGYADEAALKLEAILEKQPYNREILYLLVDCYLDGNKPAEAEKAVIRLVEQEPANYPKFLQLVENYIKINDLESAVRILSMSSEHLLVGGKPDEFLKWTNEILARNPEQLDALRLLVRYYGWQRDEIELKNSLERLAETAHQQSSVDDERYALSQLVMILPHEVGYAQRLQEINHKFGVFAEPAKESSFNFQDSKSDIPLYDNFAAFDQTVVNKNAENLEDYPEYTSQVSFSDAEDAFIYAENAGNGSVDLPNVETLSKFGFEIPGTISNELKPADEMRLGQEIESVQFYVAQGYFDLAVKTLDALEAEFGMRPEFAEMRGQMSGGAMPETKTEIVPRTTDFEVENFANTVEAPKTPEVQNPAKMELFDDFRSDLGFEDTEIMADEEDDYETHYHLAIAYKEMGLMEESIREFQDAVNMVRADDGTRRFFQCCNLLGHCFMEQGMPNLALLWFRRALETPNLNAEEIQAVLYETASAYEMGGEMPKAVECFEQIYAVNVDYRDVSARLETLREHNFAM